MTHPPGPNRVEAQIPALSPPERSGRTSAPSTSTLSAPATRPHAAEPSPTSQPHPRRACLPAGAVSRRGATTAPIDPAERRTARSAVLLTLAFVLTLATSACTRGSASERTPIHLNPNMDDQPRYEAQEASEFFADGKAMRTPVEGTVARGALAATPEQATGLAPGGGPVATIPVRVTPSLLERGAERYAIYCAPCHADSGDGQSMLRQRSGVATADLLQPRLRGESDGYLYRVIVDGFGLMPSYAYQLQGEDRWAVVAWVRELQRRAGGGSEAAAAETGDAGQTAGGSDQPSGGTDQEATDQ